MEESRSNQQLKEAIEINKSLFNLRQVITALTENTKNFNKTGSKGGFDTSQQYVPYRESKLTTILRQSLGGNSYCLMIGNLSPVSQFIDENMSTLQYASKAQHISNRPKVNVDPRSLMIMQQKETIEKQSRELRLANDQVKFLMNAQKCKTCDKHLEKIAYLE